MLQRRLGQTGLVVSRLGLGTMTWGRDTDEVEARDLLHTFLDAGGTLLDTADSFGSGAAEALVGDLVADMGVRSDLVIVTKAGRGVGGAGPDCSRRHLLDTLDASLARLRTDHVDLWLLDGWDEGTPLAETLAAADAATASGRVHYAGVCNLAGWQTAAAGAFQRARSAATPLAAAMVEYSLLARSAEREVLPATRALGMGVLVSSPLGRGVLTGKYRHGVPADSRGATPHLASFVDPYLTDSALRVVDALATAADGLGVAPLEVALAWVRDRPDVGSAVLGARTAAQLRAALTTEGVELPAEITSALDDVSGALCRSWDPEPRPSGTVGGAP